MSNYHKSMDKVYIIEANSLICGGKRAQYQIVGLENALAEYDDCKNDGECPELYETEITPTGLILKGKKIK